jgi:hypothetical protein
VIRCYVNLCPYDYHTRRIQNKYVGYVVGPFQWHKQRIFRLLRIPVEAPVKHLSVHLFVGSTRVSMGRSQARRHATLSVSSYIVNI